MAEWIFLIYIIETIIGVYIIRKAFKKQKELEKTIAELSEMFIDSLNLLLVCCHKASLIISNQKTDNVIMGNDVYLVDIDSLLDICYATLFTLHNNVNSHKFTKNDKLNETIRFYFRDICKQIGADEIGERIATSFIGKYNDFKSKDLDTLKQAFQFLYRIGLITITPVSDSIESIPNIRRDLSISDSRINYKD